MAGLIARACCCGVAALVGGALALVLPHTHAAAQTHAWIDPGLLAANFLPSRESQQFYTGFGRLPTRSDVQDNPPGTIALLRQRKVVTVSLSVDDDRAWQRTFEGLFRPR